MTTIHYPLSLLLAVDKHKIAGLVVIVLGALAGLYGGLRALRQGSGAALVALGGVAVVVVGVLVYTHTIRA